MTKPKWAVVFDCDGTLTPKSKSLFDIINQKLDRDCFQKSQRLKKFYFSKIASHGYLSKTEESGWLLGAVELCQQSRMCETLIKHFIGAADIQEPIFREGVHEALFYLKKARIPVAIVSYGISDFIQAALRASELSNLVDKIYAAKLVYGDRFSIKGIDMETAVFPSNKGKFSAEFAAIHGLPLNRVLAIGDARSDSSLTRFKNHLLGIAENEEDRKRLLPVMGEVVVATDFNPVSRWLFRKIGI